MTNPFERDDINYYVLVNDEGQHSLWPGFADIPAGWSQVFDGTRVDCLAYVDANWTDMRPKSLIRSMEGAA